MKAINIYETNPDNPPVNIEIDPSKFTFYGDTGVMAISFNLILQNGEVKEVSIEYEPDGILYEVVMSDLQNLKSLLGKNAKESMYRKTKIIS